MGNTSNKGTSEPAMLSYSTREENPYETGPLSRFTQHSTTPPVPPRMLPGLPPRRAMTLAGRERPHMASDPTQVTPGLRRLSLTESTLSPSPSIDVTVSDEVGSHVVENRPKDSEVEVPLGTTITVYFDKDVRTVNINKLFEVHCDSVDPSLNPVKGRISYDARQQRAEFIPNNTLYPNAKYRVLLIGRAITTTQCPHSANIKNVELHFQTCNPAPKHIGIKLKGQSDQPERIQIANYYDLYNSLIVWSTRKWGCSGEHVTAMYIQNEDGKLQPLKADHDVLNLKEDEVIVVEIKD